MSDLLIYFFYTNLFSGKDVKIGNKLIKLENRNGLKQYRWKDLLIIEQNPMKQSLYGKMAKNGSKIMWIIDSKNNKYLYVVINGRIIKKNK